MRSFAEELAKRDYVVLNLNPYGSGLSETPKYNENDQGVDAYDIFATPMGVLDAVNFVRSLEFVDTTNIGLTGHSQGSRRTGYAALMDCGYYSFNDVMINVLSDTFGMEFTEEEINMDAAITARLVSSIHPMVDATEVPLISITSWPIRAGSATSITWGIIIRSNVIGIGSDIAFAASHCPLSTAKIPPLIISMI